MILKNLKWLDPILALFSILILYDLCTIICVICAYIKLLIICIDYL